MCTTAWTASANCNVSQVTRLLKPCFCFCSLMKSRSRCSLIADLAPNKHNNNYLINQINHHHNNSSNSNNIEKGFAVFGS